MEIAIVVTMTVTLAISGVLVVASAVQMALNAGHR